MNTEKRKTGPRKGTPSPKRLYTEPTRTAKVPKSWNVPTIAKMLAELHMLVERWDQRVTLDRRHLPRWQHTGELLEELRLILPVTRQED
jgi:hypothetical protein